MAQTAHSGTVGGNTTTPPFRLRRACFTLNNYTSEETAHIIRFFEIGNHKYIIGKEVGEQGTPHLQGYVEFHGQVRFSKLKDLNNRIHWEKARGNKKQNIAYCAKEENATGPLLPINHSKLILDKEYKGVIWKSWQQEILDLLKTDPDSRSIHWYYDEAGNVGKSYLCKYIALTHKVIIGQGKSIDIFNQIKTAMDQDDGACPNIVILDVPRSHLNYINYSAIESIKNGLIYSGKYEGGQCIFPHPHILVFCNSEPDLDAMSKDRYKVKKI